MFTREVKLPQRQSFFLFGARGTGKSTLLKRSFPEDIVCTFDLLRPEVEERLARRPESLLDELAVLPTQVRWIILDEIQKVPKLLDVVHHTIENQKNRFWFAMTGSSGRKLRRGGANLLAGRAFVRDLFPLTKYEIGAQFNLQDVLSLGTLPLVYQHTEADSKAEFLTSYVRTYLSEEIQKEQVVRNLDPFRHFLELSAQYNGKVINYSGIAKGIGVDPKTVAGYYQVLEDTLIGNFLLPFSRSFRKKLLKSPKFYFFDTGITRAMARQLTIPLVPSTSYYGEVFEQFIFNEIKAYCHYSRNDYRLSFYQDENGIEVDFVIERPNQPLLFLEVKSAEIVTDAMTKSLRLVSKDFPDAQFQLWSRDNVSQKIGNVLCVPWEKGLEALRQTANA